MSLLYTLNFNLTELDDALRVGELDRGFKVKHVSMFYATYQSEWIGQYLSEPLVYYNIAKVIQLNHEHWLQFLVIKDLLPPEQVIDYFLNQPN